MRQGAMVAGLALAALALGAARAGGASPDSEAGALRGRLLRVIDDPPTAARWLLYEDTEHPGRPGRLVLIPLEEAGIGPACSRTKGAALQSRVPILHAGDRLTVEERTAAADATLAAVALGQAAEGGELEVRLEIGGKVVRAVAEGPRRARFVREAGVLP
jgi:hypothetical protein